jgi:hypothetical protein
VRAFPPRKLTTRDSLSDDEEFRSGISDFSMAVADIRLLVEKRCQAKCARIAKI